MKKHTLELAPRDLLFLRDARPMEASDAGLGANWPRPDQLYHALLAAFRMRWPQRQPWEGDEHTRRSGDRDGATFRFGALKTVGPFPKKEGKLFFPRPLDLGMELAACEGTDLPAPLEYAFLPKAKGKVSLPQWISEETYKHYLEGKTVFELSENDSDLYATDRNIGIAVDPATGTAAEHRLYQAEYLRLREGVSLACEASCEMKLKGQDRFLDAYDPSETGGERIEQMVLGGQQGMCSITIKEGGLALPKRPPNQEPTRFVRWTLLTPSVFAGGWLPGWVEPSSGSVMLKNLAPRRPDEPRRVWKARQEAAPAFGAKLVAARIEKPIAFSGWKLGADTPSGNAKPTLLAVPAGSCYVFACTTRTEAQALADALDGVPRSDFFGSQGFGIGVCSFLPSLPKNNTQTQG